MIVYTLKLDDLAQRFVAPAKSLERGHAFLIDDEYDVLWSPDRSLYGKNILEESEGFPAFQQIVEKMRAGKPGTGEYSYYKFDDSTGQYTRDKEEKLIAYAPIRIGKELWAIGVWAPEEDARRLIQSAYLKQLSLVGLVILVIVLGSSYALAMSSRITKILEKEVETRTRDLKVSEEKNRRAAEEWRRTFDSISDLVSIHDRDFRILRVNKAFEDKFGVPREEIVGRHCYEVFHDKSTPWPNCPHEKTLATNKPTVEDVDDPNLGGIFSIATSPIYEDGEIVGTVHVCRDITQRRRMEGELRSSREFMKNVLKSSADAIVTTDTNGQITSWNKGAERIYGYKAKDIIGKSVFDLYPAPLKKERAKWFDELMAGKDVKGVRTRIYRADGSLVDISLSLALMRDSEGTPMGTVGISKDITDQVRAEEALKESEESFRNLFDSTLDGVYRTDAKGVFTLVNQAWAEICGHESPEEVIDKPAVDYWANPEDREAFVEELKRRKSVKDYHIRGKRRDGEEFDVEVTSRVLEDEDGNFLGIEGIIRDVTERKRVEREITALYAIDKALRESLELGDVLRKAQDNALKVTGADAAGILLLEDETLVLKTHHGLPDYFVKMVSRIKMGEGITGKAVESMKPVTMDLSNYVAAVRPPKLVQAVMKEGFQSIVSVPLLSKGKRIGAITLGYRKPHAFPPEELDFLSSIALQIAIAVENSKLYDEIKESYEKLKSLDELKSNVISNVSHELRTPITVAKGA
ncbi:MAG: PAS domain S-box protein, partial [Candidatus Hydrothermarchaeaceae archaeon]